MLALALVPLTLAGPSCSRFAEQCDLDADCAPGSACLEGSCLVLDDPGDAGAPPHDAGADGGEKDDAGPDAGGLLDDDAGSDDAGPDDAGPDDAGPDDAGPEDAGDGGGAVDGGGVVDAGVGGCPTGERQCSDGSCVPQGTCCGLAALSVVQAIDDTAIFPEGNLDVVAPTCAAGSASITHGADPFMNLGVGRLLLRFPSNAIFEQALAEGRVAALSLILTRSTVDDVKNIVGAGQIAADALLDASWFGGEQNGEGANFFHQNRRSAQDPGQPWTCAGASGLGTDVSEVEAGRASVDTVASTVTVPLDPAAFQSFPPSHSGQSLSVLVRPLDGTVRFVAASSEAAVGAPGLAMAICAE